MMKIPISAKAEEQKYKNVFYSYPSSFSVEDFFQSKYALETRHIETNPAKK